MVFEMADTLTTALSLENHHPSTVLFMDSCASSSNDTSVLEMNRQVVLTLPPDINLPLSSEQSPPPHAWDPEHCDNFDVGLGSQIYEAESFTSVPKFRRKCTKRIDSIWGAWVFFSFYFKPVLMEKSKAKLVIDENGISGFNKCDLQVDIFMVQHDMENMYMWAFKERPENGLGKMQLRSYMNGHSRQGEPPFPFSVNKGFVRSHRMQRKHYRGLSNPQCVHGIEVVPSPTLIGFDEDDRKRWMELTGREFNFSIPPEASDYGSWRNLPSTEFELEKPQPTMNVNQHFHSKQLLNGSVFNLATHLDDQSNGEAIHLSPVGNKRKKSFSIQGSDDGCYLAMNASQRIPDLDAHMPEPHWLSEVSGVLRNVYGPVTAAKSTYEDEKGYLILISFPFVDLQSVKVTWRNTLTHGIIKVSCLSTSGTSFIKRHSRTFKLADPHSEHCPPGEFVREIPLSTRIPEGAKIEAYFNSPGALLEILVPKLCEGPVEHEVRVCLRPGHEGNDLILL